MFVSFANDLIDILFSQHRTTEVRTITGISLADILKQFFDDYVGLFTHSDTIFVLEVGAKKTF